MTVRILYARNLSKAVPSAEGELAILDEVSLSLNKGDSLAIVGTSGSGKSTLLGLLAGLDLPSSGEVHLAGHQLGDLDEDQRARVRAEHVGFVFQSFQLLDSLNALENVMLPLELDGRRDARERATELPKRPSPMTTTLSPLENENCSENNNLANNWVFLRIAVWHAVLAQCE